MAKDKEETLTLDDTKESEGWSEQVEDLVDQGDLRGAISLLESLVSRLSATDDSSSDGAGSDAGEDLRLSAALSDLADLYSAGGFSLKSDELRSRALAVRSRVLGSPSTIHNLGDSDKNLAQKETTIKTTTKSNKDEQKEEDEDDWEAIAERVSTGETLLSLKPVSEEAKSGELGKNDKGTQIAPKRKGRGSFLYNQSMLYSDHQELNYDSRDCSNKLDLSSELDKTDGSTEAQFGTRHVLVLYDFAPSTQTTDLENIFEGFNDKGFVIRWINDTCALAVFRTPSLAIEAKKCVPSRYKVRFLSENDELSAQLKSRDVEPPIPRPSTSARAAQRMIAQGMGFRLPNNMSPNDPQFKKQESDRRDRIAARRSMRDEAWGPD